MSYTFTLAASPRGTREIDALTGVRRDQFLTAAMKELDDTFKVPSDYFKSIAEELDEDADEQYVELWTISREGRGKPLYEMWYFPNAENGAVFGAGTAKSVGVEMIQGCFEAPDGGTKAESLAEELQDSFDERENADEEEDDFDDLDDEDEEDDDVEEDDDED